MARNPVITAFLSVFYNFLILVADIMLNRKLKAMAKN